MLIFSFVSLGRRKDGKTPASAAIESQACFDGVGISVACSYTPVIGRSVELLSFSSDEEIVF